MPSIRECNHLGYTTSSQVATSGKSANAGARNEYRGRQEYNTMRRIMVLQARDIIALVDRIAAGDGTVENEQLYAGLQRLDRTPMDEPTIFDRIDATRQGGFPPDGRWPNNR